MAEHQTLHVARFEEGAMLEGRVRGRFLELKLWPRTVRLSATDIRRARLFLEAALNDVERDEG